MKLIAALSAVAMIAGCASPQISSLVEYECTTADAPKSGLAGAFAAGRARGEAAAAKAGAKHCGGAA